MRLSCLYKPLALGALLLAAGGAVVSTPSNEKSSGQLAFEQLKALVGEWEGTSDGEPVKITYTLVAGGTALLERMQPAKEQEMITLYSADGSRIQASHYCSYGNQPRMSTDILKGSGNKFVFSLTSISGLRNPDEGHMTGLVLTLVDRDHMTQEWRHTNKGKSGAETVEFVRKPEKAATVVPSGNR